MGERFALVYMRKMVGYYLKGARSATAIRAKLMKSKSCEEVEEIIDSLTF